MDDEHLERLIKGITDAVEKVAERNGNGKTPQTITGVILSVLKQNGLATVLVLLFCGWFWTLTPDIKGYLVKTTEAVDVMKSQVKETREIASSMSEDTKATLKELQKANETMSPLPETRKKQHQELLDALKGIEENTIGKENVQQMLDAHEKSSKEHEKILEKLP